MSDLHAAALDCLLLDDPVAKVAATRRCAALFHAGALRAGHAAPPRPIADPGRPSRPLLVPPRQLAQRGLGSADGRAALVHAVAHIEFNAINLAWDAVYRFRDMPEAFYADWIGVAVDEARHFSLLGERLAGLGHRYGDFAAHNGLWEAAVATAGSCLERMALVPRVLEARGLDVTPGMIERLRAVGDAATVAILEVILHEEVAHVAAGSRWFAWCCAAAGVEPGATFDALLRRHMPGRVKGPFNTDARLRAGFSVEELTRLGELAA
ncbi:ferritin-like domain-containing protein [Dokdonella koreensis]|uniref:Ferritin-like domain-containing protein n=1 Tax=Dokdonella koreensis DS-123 TaxID=1300342 RepID=A0A161HRP4_9GAMM|nr:ferritin-like domain-containing protein [Dokdonella koreensis]ANB19172.1 Hypothetical protein I596_3182 [Dokdonella koreensis DS-123]